MIAWQKSPASKGDSKKKFEKLKIGKAKDLF